MKVACEIEANTLISITRGDRKTNRGLPHISMQEAYNKVQGSTPDTLLRRRDLDVGNIKWSVSRCGYFHHEGRDSDTP
jgi:hypothetical protein